MKLILYIRLNVGQSCVWLYIRTRYWKERNKLEKKVKLKNATSLIEKE